MPKIPQNTIDRIRDQADIVDIISQEVKLKRKGVNYFGVCPFHDEKTPSFSVSPSKQIYHCFGCGNGGNVFTFLMEFQKLNFYEAVKSLADKYNVIIDTTQKSSNSSEYSFLYHLQSGQSKYSLRDINLLCLTYSLFLLFLGLSCTLLQS